MPSISLPLSPPISSVTLPRGGGDVGHRSWTLVATHLEGRTGKQCRERWHNQLDDSIRKEPWTAGASTVDRPGRGVAAATAEVTPVCPDPRVLPAQRKTDCSSICTPRLATSGRRLQRS